MLYSHNQLYIDICLQKQNDAIKTSGHISVEEYTFHFIESVVCEIELETEQNCNTLTPNLMAITAFLSQSGVWDMVFIPASSVEFQLLNRES